MSASKVEKTRFWVVFFPDHMPEGTVFKPGKTHLTIVPWFVCDKLDEEVINSFENFNFGPKLEIVLSDKSMFGPKKDVPVNLLESSKGLFELHLKTLAWLNNLEARWAVKNSYVGDEYMPHIRRRAGTRLKQGNIFKIGSLTLVTADRREDGIRIVSANTELI